MTLFDTNVLIDYWRKPEELLKLNITPETYAICGAVKTELLHGARDDDEVDRMLGFFNSFKLLFTDEYDYEMTGLLLNTLRRNGIQVPTMDAFIAFTALKYDAELWTKDKHFDLIQSIYPELKLRK